MHSFFVFFLLRKVVKILYNNRQFIFQIATRVTKFMIDNFGVSNLFGRDNYEFYARITGRILKVEEDWIFSFRYPPDTLVSSKFLWDARIFI